MKRPLLIILTITTILSCNKSENLPQWDSSKSYIVEGYLYSNKYDGAIAGKRIAISQTERKYSHSDPQTITDSNGYFKLEYFPSGEKNGLNIYPVYQDYSCVFSNISFITNIPKGQNVNLKKLTTSN